ncbi:MULTISPECIES: TIM-barrel domain-containing protein [unclassified Microbacterium]|uniref:glycoside hydrolase family 31 protein n=1 Tax=unclassified Microbacterium TaxID=2609290 RepID=UPI001E562149|nr:TIM-barrel domain-containing protein [Microbacterium sp. Au-Mic1]MCE4027175.1 family 31 glucosidase [Microbacterium sp. Au-Mic1]
MTHDDTAIIERRHRGETLRVEPWGPDAIRVRATRRARIDETRLGGLEHGSPSSTGTLTRSDDGGAALENGRIRVTVDPRGNLTFTDPVGRILLAEDPQTLASTPPRYSRREGGSTRLDVRFAARAEERLFGLGQQQHGLLDQKGAVIDLIQHNSNVSIPFLLSNRGYGLLWNDPSPGRVELGRNRTQWSAQNSEQVDYIVIAGETPADILGRYTGLVGRAPRFPDWASGFVQSRLRYASQEEVLAVAREHVGRGLPLASIVIDYFHWNFFGDWSFDEALWPDPAAMVAELRDLGVEPLVSVWPAVNESSRNFRAMERSGFLMTRSEGLGVAARFLDTGQDGPAFLHFYDPSNPDARAFVWDAVTQGYRRHGIESFWLDACEPEIVPQEPSQWDYAAGRADAVGNLYPHWNARAFSEGMTGDNPRNALNLTRSAWHGTQRYGVALWSGDVPSTFASLRAQIPAGINAGLSGMAWWCSDIGGFHGEETNDSEAMRELMARWLQFGVFSPIMRLHGHRIPDVPGELKHGAPNEVWSFGDDVLAIATKLLDVRETLRPYLHRVMEEARDTGLPAMRALFLQYPEEERAWEVEDQFLLGSDVLVAPLTERGAETREVFVPAGEWIPLQSGTVICGPVTTKIAVPLDGLPALVRAGTEVAAELATWIPRAETES